MTYQTIVTLAHYGAAISIGVSAFCFYVAGLYFITKYETKREARKEVAMR